MTRQARASSAWPLLLALCMAAASAQEPVPPSSSRELYEQALQSIAEGRKNDASAALEQVVADEPTHAGAWLDLALIQCSLGQAETAERLFAAIEQRFNPPPGIVEVIANVRRKGCATWPPHSESSVTLGRGIDQNVNQGSSSSVFNVNGIPAVVEFPLLPEFLPRHDQYTQVGADYLRELTPNGVIGFAQLQLRRNDSLHQYDNASLFVGAERPWRLGAWAMRGTILAGTTALGGHLYQNQAQVLVRLAPPLALPYKTQLHLTASITHVNYATLDNFNANTAEVRAQLNYRSDAGNGSATLAWLNDHAIGLRPGGDRTGDLFSVQWRQRLGVNMSGEFAYTTQSWRGDAPYAPGLINAVREQRTHVVRGVLTWPLARQQNVLLELRAVRNRENISLFQYNNQQLQLSWQWLSR